MNRDEYQAQQDAIFAQLDRHASCPHPPISMQRYKKWRTVCAWGMYLGSMVVGASLTFAGFDYLSTGPHPANFNEVSKIATMVAVVSPAVLGFANSITETKGEALVRGVSRKILKVFGLAVLPSPEEAKGIADLCQTYPRLAEICTQWAARNARHVLTNHELAALHKADRRLTALNENWRASESERRQAEEALTALNQHGLLDRAVALAQQTQLEQGTSETLKVAAPRRF